MVSLSLWNTWRMVFSCMAICAIILTSVSAQGMAADYERMEKYAQRVVPACSQPTVSPHWLPSNNSFWYRKDTGKDKFEFIFVDTVKKVRKLAFDHARLAEVLSTQGLQTGPSMFPFRWIYPSNDGSVVRFRAGNKKWQFGLNGTLAPYSGDMNEDKLQPISDKFPSLSGGESTSITFVNEGKTPISLFWVDTTNKAIPYPTIEAGQSLSQQTYAMHVWRLTDSATGTSLNFRATQNEALAVFGAPQRKNFPRKQQFVEEAPQDTSTPIYEQADQSGLASNDKANVLNSTQQSPSPRETYYSPNGGWFVEYETVEEQNHTVYMVESSPAGQVQPILKYNQYLKPGDKVAVHRPRLYVGTDEVQTNDSLFRDPWTINHMGWSADGTEYRFLYNQRGHQVLRILGMNREGEIRVIQEEKQDTFIDYSGKMYPPMVGADYMNDDTFKAGAYIPQMRNKDELIWASERDGWNHLYLIDMKTGSIKQITKGEWVMRSVEHVDEGKRQIWFKGFGMVPGQDHYHAHLARVNFDGTGYTVLTEGDGTHSWKWSPDRKFFIDTWSRVDLAPKQVLRQAETGKLITELEKGDLECLRAVGWTVPERFVAPGRDSKTDIYGIIIKPSNFDPSKKYPIIEQIYAGPQDFFVPKPFGLLQRQHEYAELGFIVVQIDGMGTSWRSKKFHDVCYKNLKDGGFLDRIAWMKKAQETRPWMDLSRVGIYGGSAGGQNAMAALLFHGEFYKAAAADSGCHDNRMDKIWWNEQFMGKLDQTYSASSNVVNAKNLTGALMLLVGELDTNVDPASTMQVVNALTKANKDYELVFVPGQNHGAGGQPYGLRRQRDFFVRELLGVQPPKRNAKAI